MICYKVEEDLISQIDGHNDVLDDLLDKPMINFKPDFDDNHIPEDDNNYQKLFYQIDIMLFYNPDREIIISALEILDQFCDSAFPTSIYPFNTYQQIINIGLKWIQDIQIVSKVLSISLYICSSKDKEFITSLGIFRFLFEFINFFYGIQLKKQNQLEKKVSGNEFKGNDYEQIFNDYIECFHQAVFFLIRLEKFYDKNDEDLKKLLYILIDIIRNDLPNDQDDTSIIDFSCVFDCINLIIPVLRFDEDEMIQTNNFFLEFLDKTNIKYFGSSFLKVVYRTKSWQFNIFNIFNNDIFINYIRNCFIFINQSFDDENYQQDKTKYQNLQDLVKFTIKNLIKINTPFPEIFEINHQALNDPSKEYFINSYFKGIEKTLKMNVQPNDLLQLFNFSFDCFLNCEFKTQKSSIGLIFQLSKIYIDAIYQNIIDGLNILISFIETGNVEATQNILSILFNVIKFCVANDQNSYDIVLGEIIEQNVLQNTTDLLSENEQVNIEISHLIQCIDEHIQKYKLKNCD